MLPKIRILTHDHIDGSAAMARIIQTLYAMAGKPFPFGTFDAWMENCRDTHQNIVEKFATVTSVLQSAEALTMAADAYARHRADEGYEYVEAKFAPQYHTAGGLTMKGAVAAMCNGLWRAGNRYGIQIVPQVCIGREATPDVGIEIAKIVMEYDGDVVLDLACDEAGHPPEKHLPAYKLTFGSRVKRECHAGEWVQHDPRDTYGERLLKNVRTAVYDLRCHGISHAIPLVQDFELSHYVASEGIRVSGCPLSNRTLGCIGDLQDLGIDALLNQGILYTFNADDDLFLPPMTQVLAACDASYNFSREQSRKLDVAQKRARFVRSR